MRKPLIAAILACVSFAASAGEADIRKALESRLGKVESLNRSPLPGLWEASVDGQVFYTDDKGEYLLSGNLIEIKSGKNLTSLRQFNALPFELALKQVRGSGKNVLVTFEDPNCGFCKRLAKELQVVKDVTVYTFLFPVLGEDSTQKAQAIWCASDRTRSWDDWMLGGKVPPPKPEKCDLTGLQKSMELGRKLRVSGTPTLFFATGERVGGYIPATEIEKRFKAN
ncbi:MAG: thiol:disulfide interchange protein [Betaproteobacteria bacterium HGW-Betaproteobacteria-11]|nr:MAG: thiol:disulfide interchange protein [Betaproteobacteria bacterium HGW-Betaproteobacteria-11]